jgi:prolipoprotein diacylglyceryl transferase
MLPTLTLGPVAVPTFPLLLLIAFWAGLSLAVYRAKQVGLEGDHVYNAGLYGLLAGLIGARVWFVLAHWENYAGDLSQIFSLSRNALSFPEGLVIAGLAILIYLQRHGVAVGLFLDALAPGLALALIIGHIGDFLGGESIGTLTNQPWGVEIAGQNRHPIQLYEAWASLLILVTLWLSRRWRPWAGFQCWLAIALYCLGRLLLEVFRANPAIIGAGYLAIQVAALAILVVTLAVMAYNFTKIRGT